MNTAMVHPTMPQPQSTMNLHQFTPLPQPLPPLLHMYLPLQPHTNPLLLPHTTQNLLITLHHTYLPLRHTTQNLLITLLLLHTIQNLLTTPLPLILLHLMVMNPKLTAQLKMFLNMPKYVSLPLKPHVPMLNSTSKKSSIKNNAIPSPALSVLKSTKPFPTKSALTNIAKRLMMLLPPLSK